MFTLVQLIDGTFRLTVEYKDANIELFKTWYFMATEESQSPEEKCVFSLKVDR